MSYFPASSTQGYNDGYNSMERTVGPKPPSVMAYPPEMRGVNGPRHFDQRNVDPRQEFRNLENNRFPTHQYQPPIPQRVVDPRQAELRALEARNAMNARGMESRAMVNGPEMRGYENRPMERLGGIDRNVNNRMDPRIGYTPSLPNNMIPNVSTQQSNPAVNHHVVGPPHVSTSMFPRPSVSDIVHIPQELSAFAADPKFQQILLRVKEQTLVNFISLNRVSDNGVESVTIDASTKEAAQLAKNLIETHLKLQIKVKAAESRLQKVQTDLFSTQGEIAAGQMVEFTIRPDLIGLAIGKKGSRIKQIETETGVSSINVSDNGHIMIYGPDSQSVQQAKEQLELLEETFSLRLPQVDWLAEKTNLGILAELKKDANLMVAKINKDNSALEVVGTSSSVQLTKFLLATQLEYIDKQIEIEANEKETREKLHAVRKQYGLNSAPWKSRGPKPSSAISPNPNEYAKKSYSGYSQPEKSKVLKEVKDDFLEAKSDLVPFTFDDTGFTVDKTFEEPLEPVHNDSDSKKDKDGLNNRKKNKEKIVEVKQNDSNDRKQGKTRTVEITVGKRSENENGKDNKSKDRSNNSNSNNNSINNKSNLKLEKPIELNPQTELSSLVVIPPPPQSSIMPPAPPAEKQSNKGKKNKKQDGGGKDDTDRIEKKSKEPMLVKINHPFQEQQAVPAKVIVEPETKDSGVLDITFPKKVSGPPKDPPARVVTLIAATTVVSTVSNDKSKDLKAIADSNETSLDQKAEKLKANGNTRSRGRNRKENSSSTHNKVDIISIVTKEQELSSDVSNMKISPDSTDQLHATEDKGDGNSTKKSRRRRRQNEKGGKNDNTGEDGDASPRHLNSGDASGEGGLKRVDDYNSNQKSDDN